MDRFYLPEQYVSRSAIEYFDDQEFATGTRVHQPEVYDAAEYFLKTRGRRTVVDIGCGNGRKLDGLTADRKIGIDFGSNLDFCRATYGWGEWIEADFADPACLALADLVSEETIVVCADVVEHILDPTLLLTLLRLCYERSAIVITSTPDRVLVRGAEHQGPPPNPSHIREWEMHEYGRLLDHHGLPQTFLGHTINNNEIRRNNTIVSIHDLEIEQARMAAPVLPRPVAILTAYNEEDVVREAILDLVEQGCDVVAIDNWSSDATANIIGALAADRPDRVTALRYPDSQTETHEWHAILRHKEELALSFPGRWIIHTDADEIRRSPFPGTDFARALDIARAMGANRVGFNLINFRPMQADAERSEGMRSGFRNFQFGDKPGHFLQYKAWFQETERVDLASSGGHSAGLSQPVDFAYKFLLQHYPLRSAEQARRKIFEERPSRWGGERVERGWHSHYSGFSESSAFVWDMEPTHTYTDDFWSEHGLLVITDILDRRRSEGYQY